MLVVSCVRVCWSLVLVTDARHSCHEDDVSCWRLPRYHPACRTPPTHLGRRHTAALVEGCDGPTRPVLVEACALFFRRLAADDGSNACARQSSLPGGSDRLSRPRSRLAG